MTATPDSIKKILCCTDFSENADLAFSYALDAALHYPGSILYLLHVIPEPESQFWRTYIYDADNDAALRRAKELCDVCNLFGYGEIKPHGHYAYESSMMTVFRRLVAPNFLTIRIERKEDVFPSFRTFLSKDRNPAGGREE